MTIYRQDMEKCPQIILCIKCILARLVPANHGCQTQGSEARSGPPHHFNMTSEGKSCTVCRLHISCKCSSLLKALWYELLQAFFVTNPFKISLLIPKLNWTLYIQMEGYLKLMRSWTRASQRIICTLPHLQLPNLPYCLMNGDIVIPSDATAIMKVKLCYNVSNFTTTLDWSNDRSLRVQTIMGLQIYRYLYLPHRNPGLLRSKRIP